MKMSQEEYKKKFEEYMKSEYDQARPKPNGMYGHMGFFKIKEREFRKKLTEEGYEIE